MPYVDPGFGSITEFESPDGSAVFLSVGVKIVKDQERLVFYLLEAPRNCPMRIAFEHGKLSFDDFVDHRGWLIRLETEVITRDDPIISYISPQQMDPKVRSYFKRYETVTPYQRLYDGLIFIRQFKKDIGEDYQFIDERIEDLLRDHSEKIAA